MNDAIDFLNRNSGALTVLFSGVVTISTVAYALLTRKLVQETILLREAETEPSLSVHITPSDRYIHITELVIQNHGRGTARKITWELSPTPESLKEHGVRLDSLALLRGLAQLAPGQQLRTIFGNSLDLLKEPACPDVTVTACYRSVTGKLFNSSFLLSPAEFRGMGRVGTPADDKIADSLEKLVQSLTSAVWSSRLHIANTTEEELREQERRITERTQRREPPSET